MHKYFKRASFTVIGIFLLNLFCYVIYKSSVSPTSMGKFSEAINNFSKFPGEIPKIIKSNEFKGIPPSYMLEKYIHDTINNLTYDVYGLNCRFNSDKKEFEIRLRNLRNNNVLHYWWLDKSYFEIDDSKQFENYEINSPILLPDYSVVLFASNTKNMMRLDKSGKVIWSNRSFIPHHTMNLDAEGNIWVCGEQKATILGPDQKKPNSFDDGVLVKIDVNTGKILKLISVAQLFKSNLMSDEIYGQQNVATKNSVDPFHLNDIQPILEDNQFGKKGDLLVSIRNRSMIISVDPDQKMITEVIQGGYINQHDVDIIDDKTIVVFNNNNLSLRGQSKLPIENVPFHDQISHSQLTTFDHETNEFGTLLDDVMNKYKIFTLTQGGLTILKNGDVFLEITNKGLLYIINENGIVYKNTIKTPIKGYIDTPRWMRIYENLDFLKN